MPPRTTTKGKKRAIEETLTDAEASDASSSALPEVPLSSVAPVKKRSKRAETRTCPVCGEAIPLRLLGKHSALESERLDEIMRCIGSTEILAEAEPDDGFTARTRRSALKARRSFKDSSVVHASASEASLEQIAKTLRALKRHRKQRHARLRELTREEEDSNWWGRHLRVEEDSEGTLCPVCGRTVRGDVDVVEAHVDSCLAHVRLSEEHERYDMSRRGSAEVDGDIDVDGEDEVITGVMDGVSFQGIGFDIPDRNQQDVDDEVDVDGEDDAVFGAPQFTEGDILAPPSDLQPRDRQDRSPSPPDTDSDPDVEIEEHDSAEGHDDKAKRKVKKTLRDLVSEGKVVRRSDAVDEVKRTMEEVMGVGDAEKVELAVEKARKAGDQTALIRALESKVNLLESTRVSSSTSSLCRICLDPYTEPTVSTGCWHTCCAANVGCAAWDRRNFVLFAKDYWGSRFAESILIMLRLKCLLAIVADA
ncbi:hypothetical protein A0H81_09845 [Grifola frondosa]|uniref:E3 ubiquitin-protein ligase RNF220 middle domain-containing protein n=1 Tax=Grifola frondosa TaxID=5627 RepID=A0A1C7LZB8_GRIFR|nr:hypothetical protein A0H81_09845 [Grifola frondosa]